MRTRVGRILSVVVAITCGVWSAFIFSGYVLHDLQTRYRLMFAAITLLYGVYRLVLGFTRREER